MGSVLMAFRKPAGRVRRRFCPGEEPGALDRLEPRVAASALVGMTAELDDLARTKKPDRHRPGKRHHDSTHGHSPRRPTAPQPGGSTGGGTTAPPPVVSPPVGQQPSPPPAPSANLPAVVLTSGPNEIAAPADALGVPRVSVVASGTASGPVGTVLYIPGYDTGDTAVSSGWTVTANPSAGGGFMCQRMANDPETTDWTFHSEPLYPAYLPALNVQLQSADGGLYQDYNFPLNP